MSAMPGLRFEVFGLAAEVTSEDPEIMAGVPEALPPGWRPSRRKAVSARFGVMRDGTVTLDGATVAGPERGDPLRSLERAVGHHVAEHSPAHVFVHAGVVSVADQAVVIPGRSMTGKSTLVAQLVALGATYYSDEYAVLDSKGTILPYPRRLRPRLGPRLGSLEAAFPPAGDVASLPPLRPGLIVVTRYVPDATWQPRRLSPGEAVLAVLDNTVSARSRPGASLASARRMVTGSVAVGGPRGPADEAAEAILGLARGSAGDIPWSAPHAGSDLW